MGSVAIKTTRELERLLNGLRESLQGSVSGATERHILRAIALLHGAIDNLESVPSGTNSQDLAGR